MATLALGALGAAVGSALPGIPFLGLTGAVIGKAAGALLGSAIDQALFGAAGQGRQVEGPRLSTLNVMASTEGSPVPRLYGTARLGGQMIWATNIEEEIAAIESNTGGKGLGGGLGGGTDSGRQEYRYYANFAVGLCEGPVARIGRVWADGKELDLTGVTWRLHSGSATQLPDSLITAKEGAGNAPAYRGLAYIVFERLSLARFGNRIPQLSFEVLKPVAGLGQQVRSVAIIPSAGEFVYATEPVTRRIDAATTASENVHTTAGGTDWSVSMDQMQAAMPNLERATLIVSWFGDDLRAGTCTVQPKVDAATKETFPATWSVAGLTRSTAQLVSSTDGRPAYGGTPTDASVVQAIQDLHARGLAVALSPFVLMDIPSGNTLPNPYGGTGQAPYAWRGRITVSPAAGQPGTVDKTAAAATQLAAFMGTATPAHFSIVSGAVVYTGPAQWSYRRMVLHYAHLALLAGGCDTFIIGSELRGLTSARSSAAAFPFVTALIALAADVKAVLGSGTKVTYAADWSEYFGHQPADGTGDVYFHLDPLWASPHIDAIGIDTYWPLADWRDGSAHLDAVAGARSPYDLAYLKSNIFGGEGYAWYYASAADRRAQVRSPITDGAGKPWVFRYKDIRNWWANPHYNRPGGVESTTPTAWVPQSKPVWLTEVGCPAVDRGANQPNVFVDAKSAESALPHFSRGARDDLAQTRTIRALLETFDASRDDFQPAHNPVSSVYGGRMLDAGRSTLYAWDARPWPAFPHATQVWADGVNWERGHWLNGRITAGDLPDVVAAILTDHGFAPFALEGLNGAVEGYVIDRILSARATLQPLELAYAFDSRESSGVLRFQHRGAGNAALNVDTGALVDGGETADLYRLTRQQETELPATAKYTFIDPAREYEQGSAEAKAAGTSSVRVASASLPLVTTPAHAQHIAERGLNDAWAARTRGSLGLPPSQLAVEPGDLVTLTDRGVSRLLRVIGVTDGAARQLDLQTLALDDGVFLPSPSRPAPVPLPPVPGPALGVFLDLPILDGSDVPAVARFAGLQSPWSGGVALYRAAGSTDFTAQAMADRPASMGETLTPLAAGPTGRWDRGAGVDVMMLRGSLLSQSPGAVLAGGNTLAVETSPGTWEVLQFRHAELIAPATYRLTGLLRGQGGTDGAIVPVLAPGARVAVIDTALAAIPMPVDDLGLPFTWRFGPASRPYTDATYTAQTHSFPGIARRPFSPVHVRGRRSAGDLYLTWIRRTRIGGDSWLPADVPLSEAAQSWRVEIMDGSTVKRTLTSSAPAAIYLAAEQAADWGTAPAAVTVRIAQGSAGWGWGTPGHATV